MFLFRPNYLAILKAFQLKELSTLLWNDEDNKKILLSYKSQALLALAQKIDDDSIGEKVALLDRVVHREGCDEEVVAQYKVWKQQNAQVYFTPVYTEKKIPSVTLAEAFDILRLSFQTHDTKSQH